MYNEYDHNPVQKTLKKRKKQRIKKRIKIIFGCLLIIGIIYILMSDFLKIKSINIYENEMTSKEDILDCISIDHSTYIFMIDKDKMKEELKTLPTVKSSEVNVDIFGKVTITIEEAKAIAYADYQGQIYEINNAGNILEINDNNKLRELKTLPKLQNFSSIDLLKQFAKGFQNVPSLMQNEISDILFDPQPADETRLKCITKDNKILYIRIEDISTKLNNERFNYEAFKTTYKDKCIFKIEGNKVYMEPCQ